MVVVRAEVAKQEAPEAWFWISSSQLCSTAVGWCGLLFAYHVSCSRDAAYMQVYLVELT